MLQQMIQHLRFQSQRDRIGRCKYPNSWLLAPNFGHIKSITNAKRSGRNYDRPRRRLKIPTITARYCGENVWHLRNSLNTRKIGRQMTAGASHWPFLHPSPFEPRNVQTLLLSLIKLFANKNSNDRQPKI